MLRIFSILLLLFFAHPILVEAQQHYIITFKDKGPEKEILLKNPQRLLTQKALERRGKMHIAVDETDLPVSKIYLKVLTAGHCKILETSKWLNAVTIESHLSASQLKNLFPQIKEVQSWKLPSHGIRANIKKTDSAEIIYKTKNGLQKTNTDYGVTQIQNELLGLEYLHQKGFRGDGVTIAVIDDGFMDLRTIAHFDSLRNEQRILATYDFWAKSTDVYVKDDHGVKVLSTMAANTPGQFVGAAPKANYLLAITDDFITETHQDELNWVKAMEWADSLGADILSASVSYSVFDSGQGDYIFSDMDGKTSISAKGAAVAVSKGLIVSNSIGNGDRICTPCDVENILCVGGADKFKAYDGFSSYGPSYDKRIKPDVAALTRNVFFVNGKGNVIVNFYGGTSSSTPQISGLAACLLQAHPKRNNKEIITAIIQSANQFGKPDTLTGYGVPNAKIADSILTAVDVSGIENDENLQAKTQFSIFPNPAVESVKIISLNGSASIKEIKIFSVIGQLVFHRQNLFEKQEEIALKNLPQGIYFLHVVDNKNKQSIFKLVKE